MQEDCKYGEHCFRPDCKYKHIVKDHKHITCIHFNTKGCLRGDHCPYSHIKKSPEKSSSNIKPENIIMQLTPVIPEEINIPVKRKILENVDNHESFSDDISLLLENYDEEIDKTLKKQKIVNQEEDDAARVKKIIDETEKNNIPEDIHMGLGNDEISKMVDDILEGDKINKPENLEVNKLVQDKNLEGNKVIQNEDKDMEIREQGKVVEKNNEAKIEVAKEKPKKNQRVLHKKPQHEGQQKEVKEPQRGHTRTVQANLLKNPGQKDQSKGSAVIGKTVKPAKSEKVEKLEKSEKLEIPEKKPEELEKPNEMLEVDNKDVGKEEKKIDKLVIENEITEEVGKITEDLITEEKPKSPRQNELEAGEIAIEDTDMGIVNENKPVVKAKEPIQEAGEKIINLKPSHEQSVKKTKEPASASKKNLDIIELKHLEYKKQTAIIDPTKKLPESAVLTSIGSTEIKLPVSKSSEKTAQAPKIKTLSDSLVKPPTPSDKTVNVSLPRKPTGVETTKILTLEEIRKKKEAAKKKEEEVSIEVNKPNQLKEQPKPKKILSPTIKPIENEQVKIQVRDSEIPPSPIANIEEPKIKQKKAINQEIPMQTGVINLPVKRPLEEKPKQTPIKVPKIDKQIKLLIGRDEWEPFQNALINLEFSLEKFSTQDAEECKNLAMKISTPEGISEIVYELEQKLSKYPDIPEDPEFERLTLTEKIDKLYKECLYL
ncbi:hypothetical protein SteCoe_7565 [Stentor coeruleus]|uniref:C3H1-type domain-containing protein n=1 Tax=Stentor coeruleus TaxID=5963 RepID=A0A1R2CMD5_9CILI|nr:hypothetical protein SteCoe_7565 [Stentor coeruleus]